MLWNSALLPKLLDFFDSCNMFCILHGFFWWGGILEFLFITSMVHCCIWFSICFPLSSQSSLSFSFAHSGVVFLLRTLGTLFIPSRALIKWVEWLSSTSITLLSGFWRRLRFLLLGPRFSAYATTFEVDWRTELSANLLVWVLFWMSWSSSSTVKLSFALIASSNLCLASVSRSPAMNCKLQDPEKLGDRQTCNNAQPLGT